MVELTKATKERIEAVFSEELVDEAAELLSGMTLGLLGDSAAELERIRIAAIRVSGGFIDALCDAIELADVDWRDLLLSAGFADDIDAHLTWTPKRFTQSVADRWMAGDLPDGVEFGLNSSVAVRIGNHRGQTGAVISLQALEPEPKYLVELSLGKDICIYQRQLKKALLHGT